MFVRRGVLASIFLLSAVSFGQVAGQNSNMVSGTNWPAGDPYLQRQNEPSIYSSMDGRRNVEEHAARIPAGYLRVSSAPNSASPEVRSPTPKFQELKLKAVPVAVASGMGGSACALSFGLHSFCMRKV